LAVGGAALLYWFKTGSTRQVSARHSIREIHKEQADVHWFSGAPQCSFFDDKVLISLPTSGNLFEPDSLFNPPLTQEDIQLSYNIMSTISGIVQTTVESLPKEMVA
ncbi:MAG: hypothetical protein AB7L92_08375, partial [Alphaproteobacteria bacterium]